ncbi:hypothetical protein [Carboxylicivirga caseinilyticus]|uniref:hypothetical protein n=1 Tax=Carboxylicivirga caseinilyticus TaxID=3417572 RepID=UPI003D32760C|nr:hypothetical protein [Marinilabiliaceae bacterium A049]
MKTFKYIQLLIIILISCNTTAQNCREFEKKCPSPPKEYKISSLSKSFSLRKKQTIYVKLTLYADRIYFLSVDGKKALGNIHLRIFENDEERKILYDNAINNFQKTKSISVQSTINLVIEVSAPSYFNDRVRECSGLLVAYKEM